MERFNNFVPAIAGLHEREFITSFQLVAKNITSFRNGLVVSLLNLVLLEAMTLCGIISFSTFKFSLISLITYI